MRKGEDRFFQRIERISLGALAASGLLVAACVSALPASTCPAMAASYMLSISYLGVAALFAAISAGLVGFLEAPEPDTKDATWPPSIRYAWTVLRSGGGRIVALFGVVIVLFGFYVLAALSLDNLRIATVWCYAGTAEEISGRTHKLPKFMTLDDEMQTLKRH